MQVQLYTDANAFTILRAEWDELLARSVVDTLFLRPAWAEAWWQVFGPEGGLRLLTVRADDGRLLGLAPLFLASVEADGAQPAPALSFERPVPRPNTAPHATLFLVGGTEVSDYLDFIVDREQAGPVYRALCEAIGAIEGWEWLDLHCLPEESLTPALLGDRARAAGWSVTLVREDVCPTIALPSTWDEYLHLLSKKDRHELRRKMRRAEEAGQVQHFVVNDAATLDECLDRFMALHEASTPDKSDFMRDPRMRDFFRRVGHLAFDQGWLDLSFLAFDGALAAAMFCFRYRDAVMVYNSGFDPQAWSSFSPGVVLLGRCIRQAIAEGRRKFDFMQGNERYKYDLGGQDRAVRRLFVRR